MALADMALDLAAERNSSSIKESVRENLESLFCSGSV
jgi:hypothetical protein